MRERDFSVAFAASISSLDVDTRIRKLYARVTGLDEKSFSDLETSVLREFLEGPEYRPLLQEVLALNETSTI